MQAIWVGFDEISGKGIDLLFILKFIGYLSLTVVPMAMPIGILLSSIMSLGTFAENYEFAAIKSAGISLRRTIAPVAIVAIFLSGVNFIFLNYIYPEATFKQRNMFINMKKKQPALALIPGAFNDAIPGFVIKFDEKYGEEQNLLKNIHIIDLSKKVGKITTITAKHGKIDSEDNSRYMTFELYDGWYFDEHSTKRDKRTKREKMPASKAKFETYTINIDISSFSNDNLDDQSFKHHPQMYSLKQLTSVSDSNKVAYNDYVKNRARDLFVKLRGSSLKKDSIVDSNTTLNDTILKNFGPRIQLNILQNAVTNTENHIKNFVTNTARFKSRRKLLNLYDHEYHNRIAFSFDCLVLFFIGAPLGSIIRKGGFGLPMVLAIVIFVVYFFISSFGRNLAEESAISSALGGWLSTIILLPFGIMLTRRAAKDKGIFSMANAFEPIKKILRKFNFKKRK